MTKKKFEFEWRQLMLEGVVIVISILLAFAIDAWWDERQAAERDSERLVRVQSELRLNSEMLQQRISFLDRAATSVYAVQGWMGPEPEIVDINTFTEAWDGVFSIGTLSLVTRAIDDFLAAGSSTSNASNARNEVNDKLSTWYYHADQLEGQYEILRQEHDALSQYSTANPRVPALGATGAVGAQLNLPKSKFPYDQSALMSDPVLESLLALYLIRLKFVMFVAKDLRTRNNELLEDIAAVLNE